MSALTVEQQANANLGEAPHWDPDAQCLYWVDVTRPTVFRRDAEGAQTGQWRLPEWVAGAVPRNPKELIVAMGKSLASLELESGETSPLHEVEAKFEHNRFNEIKADRRGRIWAGSTDRSGQPNGSLYRLDADRSLHVMEEGFTIANGIGWSPDDSTLYVGDTPLRTIWAYDFNPNTGSISNRRMFYQLGEDDGLPDGLTVDADGFVWSCVWDGWRIDRIDPDGKRERSIELPIQRPTSCIFGGINLDRLFVTSACTNLTAADLNRGPLAGALFSVSSGVCGLPEHAYAG